MFQSQEVDYEIIFINDNSPTEDEAAICALCEKDPHVIGVSHSRNFGSKSAHKSVRRYVKTQTLCWLAKFKLSGIEYKKEY